MNLHKVTQSSINMLCLSCIVWGFPRNKVSSTYLDFRDTFCSDKHEFGKLYIVCRICVFCIISMRKSGFVRIMYPVSVISNIVFVSSSSISNILPRYYLFPILLNIQTIFRHLIFTSFSVQIACSGNTIHV
uniref:Uncharacterized protein n=1 Tax=Cacopsylla melanoneura TaxID=428564 RepID=A0A8D8U063_9HEMI